MRQSRDGSRAVSIKARLVQWEKGQLINQSISQSRQKEKERKRGGKERVNKKKS